MVSFPFYAMSSAPQRFLLLSLSPLLAVPHYEHYGNASTREILKKPTEASRITRTLSQGIRPDLSPGKRPSFAMR
jgi:hypothetical protein